MKDAAEHYVYVLFRSNGAPFYVGMGVGDRINHHLHRRHRGRSHKDHLIRTVVAEMGDLPRVKIAEGLTREEAAGMERSLIAAIGRKPDGRLLNQTEGGDGTFNLPPDVMAARNARISATKRARATRKPPKPKADPAETRVKRSAAAKAARQRPEVDARITAAIRSAVSTEEARAANRARGQAHWDAASPEDRAGHGEMMKGVLARPDVKAKLKASSQRRWADPAERERYREIGRRAAAARWSR